MRRVGVGIIALFATAGALSAAEDQPTDEGAAGALTEHVEVTATRLPEDTDVVPGLVSIVTREDLERRGARTLPMALALLGGVSIAPGGDGGPASSVPELMGLREFDAFLLTVDGVPWGGAFIPDLPTIDLNDVDRIEVLHGSAPVMYGATSFVGVINVIRERPGEGGIRATAEGGSYGSWLGALDAPLPELGGLRSSVSAEVSNTGFDDSRTEFDRRVLRWQGLHDAWGGQFHFDAGWTGQDQDPASPRPREGTSLSPQVPVDSNHNPRGSELDANRYVLGTTFEHPMTSGGSWSMTLSTSRNDQDVLRGFLSDLAAPTDNAHGFRQDLEIDEIYFDGHVQLKPREDLRVVAGVDHLHGRGEMDGGDFDYTVGLDGSNPPDGDAIPNAGEQHVTDRRDFSGLYGQAFWDLAARWHLEGGLRFNRTAETRDAREVELSGPTVETGSDSATHERLGGMVGATFTAWQRQEEALYLFADYRNTFKPAVVDFGPEAEPEILDAEEGECYELGVKGRLHGGRVSFAVSLFDMDLENIVVSQSVGGVPTLENAGEEDLQGVDAESRIALSPALALNLGYSYHDATFGDYLTEFDGVPTQLDGNRIEMSANDMASAGLSYGLASGWQGYAQANYVGSRYLNKRNTALAPDYTAYDAGIAYRFREWELRLDGRNLGDARDPVAESELGDAQYYLLAPRRIEAGIRWLPASKTLGG